MSGLVNNIQFAWKIRFYRFTLIQIHVQIQNLKRDRYLAYKMWSYSVSLNGIYLISNSINVQTIAHFTKLFLCFYREMLRQEKSQKLYDQDVNLYCAILSEAVGKIMIVCLTPRNLLFQIDVMSK